MPHPGHKFADDLRRDRDAQREPEGSTQPVIEDRSGGSFADQLRRDRDGVSQPTQATSAARTPEQFTERGQSRLSQLGDLGKRLITQIASREIVRSGGTPVDTGPPLSAGDLGSLLVAPGELSAAQFIRGAASIPFDATTEDIQTARSMPFTERLGRQVEAPLLERLVTEGALDPFNLPIIGPLSRLSRLGGAFRGGARSASVVPPPRPQLALPPGAPPRPQLALPPGNPQPPSVSRPGQGPLIPRRPLPVEVPGRVPSRKLRSQTLQDDLDYIDNLTDEQVLRERAPALPQHLRGRTLAQSSKDALYQTAQGGRATRRRGETPREMLVRNIEQEEFLEAERAALEPIPISSPTLEVRAEVPSGVFRRGIPQTPEGVPSLRPLEARTPQEAVQARAQVRRGLDPIAAQEESIVARAVPESQPVISASSTGPVVSVPSQLENSVLKLRPIQANLSKLAVLRNSVRNLFSRLPDDAPSVVFERAESNGIIAERRRIKLAGDSISANLGTQVGTLLRRSFTLDSNGGITALARIDPTLPGAPTISDVASRLPRYAASLTPEQASALDQIRRLLEPWRKMQNDLGIVIDDAVDVIEGGFYIPRGPVIGTQRVSGRRVTRVIPGSQKERQFLSQAAGIRNGERYMLPGRALQNYVRETTNQVNDNWTAKYLQGIGERMADEGPTGKVALSGGDVDVPIDIANAINSEIRREGGRTGLSGVTKWPLYAIGLWRNFKTTLDNSAPMIQGLLGLATNQKAWGRAMKANLRASVDPEAQGRFLISFDKRAKDLGTPTSIEWAGDGLHFGGGTTEFTSEALSKIPGIRQANRMFSTFGDSIRLSWAEEELLMLMKSSKQSIAELRQNGETTRIADVINNATGWSKGRFGADIGEFVLFAPRFLQARLETLFRAAVSVPASGRGLIPGQPGASLDQRIARKAIIRTLAFGTGLTFAANYALGNETETNPTKRISAGTRPLKKGEVGNRLLRGTGRRTTKDKDKVVYNNNFMTISYLGRDWSAFGSQAGVLAFLIRMATGEPVDAIQAVANMPASALRDVFRRKDFEGDPIPLGAQEIADDPRAFAEWIADQAAPIAVSDGVEIGKDVVSGRLGSAATKAVADFHGVRSSEQSKGDRRNAIMKIVSNGRYTQYNPPNLSRSQKRTVNSYKTIVDDILLESKGVPLDELRDIRPRQPGRFR